METQSTSIRPIIVRDVHTGQELRCTLLLETQNSQLRIRVDVNNRIYGDIKLFLPHELHLSVKSHDISELEKEEFINEVVEFINQKWK